jgi:hypothetical protein
MIIMIVCVYMMVVSLSMG